MARRPFSDGSCGDEQLVRQLPALLRQHRPDLMEGKKLYRSPPGFTSWSGHWAKAQQPEHTDFRPTHRDWDADGVRGTAAGWSSSVSMSCWCSSTPSTWWRQRGHWRDLSPLVG